MRCGRPGTSAPLGGLLVALAHLFDVGLQLLGLGLQVVGAHQLGHHQAQAHAALGLGLEQLGRDRRLVGVLDATLLQVGAGTFDQALQLVVDQGLGQVERATPSPARPSRRLVAGQHAELDFALQVLLDVGAQALDRAVGLMPSALDEGFVDSGRCWASIFFSVTRKSASLPATSLPW
jgi:hypothetical protein